MRDAKSEIEALGARLAIVGNGPAHFAKAFAEDHGLQGVVYTDQRRAVYRALGLKRGVRRTLTLEAAKNAVRAFRAGHRQSATKGDPWQQGGTVVVNGEGDLLYVYVSRTSGDHAPVDEVLTVLREGAA